MGYNKNMGKRKIGDKVLIVCLSFVLVAALSFYKLIPRKANLSPENGSKTSVGVVTPTSYVIPRPTIDASQIKLVKPNGWIDYVNQEYGFAIAYPTKLNKSGLDQLWIYKEYSFPDAKSSQKGSSTRFWVGFGPKESIPGGMVWGITVYENGNLEDIIESKGEQFADRKEERTSVKVDGIDAILVTVTTTKFKDWISKNVIVQKGNFIYSISNGAEEISEYDSFYKSFQLIK